MKKFEAGQQVWVRATYSGYYGRGHQVLTKDEHSHYCNDDDIRADEPEVGTVHQGAYFSVCERAEKAEVERDALEAKLKGAIDIETYEEARAGWSEELSRIARVKRILPALEDSVQNVIKRALADPEPTALELLERIEKRIYDNDLTDQANDIAALRRILTRGDK